MKSYTINLMILRVSKRETVEIKTSAKMCVDSSTTFSTIFEFMDSAKEIWKKAMNAGKKGHYYEMEIIVAEYDGLKPDEELTQKEFNRWYCTIDDQDDKGIYLKFDTRYTGDGHDMYLTKNTLQDLAVYLT